MRSAHTSEASIKVLTVKILFDFHELQSSLFERTVRLGSSMINQCSLQSPLLRHPPYSKGGGEMKAV